MVDLVSATEQSPKYRLLKVWKKFVVQKRWMWITPTSYWSLVPAYSNETDPVDYDTAIAYIKMWTWNMEIYASWNTLDDLTLKHGSRKTKRTRGCKRC